MRVATPRNNEAGHSAAYSRNQKDGVRYAIIDDKNPGFTHRRSWCGEHSLG